jgi:hypothetical protein
MTILRAVALPFHAAALMTGAKSFRDNPVIGSPALNRRGLHVARIRLAERMADWRRSRLARLADPADRAAFARDGFVVRRNALPEAEFALLRAEVEGRAFEAREMRQGCAVTRFVELPPAVLATTPTLAAVVRSPLLQGLMRHVAATDAEPMLYLHTVLTDPDGGAADPQTDFHSDTFHATAKAWLFLSDVAAEDGPFVYVPGSHRTTPGRLAWERAQSLTAAANPDRHHADGSFRAAPAEIEAMGYGAPVAFAVPANTLVVADTRGFHARGRSLRRSTRVALYASLRRNPFLPWTGLDPMSIPLLRGRGAQLFGALLDLAAAMTGRPNGQPRVGAVAPTDPVPRV